MSKSARLHEMGPAGTCICPKCEAQVPHTEGTRCQDRSCPNCNTKMLRIGSHHYELWLKNKK